MGIYDTIQLDGLLIICTNPISIKRDNENKLHSEISSAIKWNDGYELYYLHGINFSKELWTKIVTKSITPQEIFKLENQEQKSIAMSIYGYENLFKDNSLPIKILDKKNTLQNSPFGLREKEFEVFEVDLKDDDTLARFVKVYDASFDNKVHILRIDPRNDECKTCDGAVAWTFGFTKEEYKLNYET